MLETLPRNKNNKTNATFSSNTEKYDIFHSSGPREKGEPSNEWSKSKFPENS